MKWDCENGYLDQFDKNYRGTIGDRFCRAVRDGQDDPKSILDWISGDLAGNPNPVWQQVSGTCNCHDPLAWDFAQHILDRESLSYEDKQVLKRASKEGKEYAKEAMAKALPTEKQLKYLVGLKCPIIPKTKLEASELIERFKYSKELPRIDIDEPPF